MVIYQTALADSAVEHINYREHEMKRKPVLFGTRAKEIALMIFIMVMLAGGESIADLITACIF